jgi:preprotein translocase subunit YajC
VTWEILIEFSAVLIVMAAAYFSLIKPQLKRIKESKKLLSSLEIGDKIVTSGGLIGTITLLDGADIAEIEVSQGVRLRIMRSAIENQLN